MTVAEKIIKPNKPGIFRTIFLYTGQGESTLLVIPTGTTVEDYKNTNPAWSVHLSTLQPGILP